MGTVPPSSRVRSEVELVSLLLVDDDDDLRRIFSIALEDHGYRVIEARDAESALYELSCHAIDVVLVDIRLPGMSGLDLCREVRRRGPTPIVAVTAHADRDDVVAGLEAGADDYVAKPVDPAELSARIRSLLRRAVGDLAPRTALRAGDLVIDVPGNLVERVGKRLDLGTAEVRLLTALAERPGVLLRREELLERVWGPDRPGDLGIVDVHAEQLRSKLESGGPGAPRLVAVPGEGYRLVS